MKGYFRYEAGARTPVFDPEVERFILDASTRLGLIRWSIAQEWIIERMIRSRRLAGEPAVRLCP